MIRGSLSASHLSFSIRICVLCPQHGEARAVVAIDAARYDAYFFAERTALVGLCFVAGGGQLLWVQALCDVTVDHPPRHNLRAMATAH
jgi:hypothetical protein